MCFLLLQSHDSTSLSTTERSTIRARKRAQVSQPPSSCPNHKTMLLFPQLGTEPRSPDSQLSPLVPKDCVPKLGRDPNILPHSPHPLLRAPHVVPHGGQPHRRFSSFLFQLPNWKKSSYNSSLSQSSQGTEQLSPTGLHVTEPQGEGQ